MTRKEFIEAFTEDVKITAKEHGWRPSELAATLAFDTPKRAARLWRKYRDYLSTLTIDQYRQTRK